jgi:hypothetical protein
VDLTEILQQLKREGYLVDSEDIKALSPYLTEHIKINAIALKQKSKIKIIERAMIIENKLRFPYFLLTNYITSLKHFQAFLHQ